MARTLVHRARRRNRRGHQLARAPLESRRLDMHARAGDDPPHMAETATLRGISEIRAFFRTNQTPIYFVSPTAFNLLGIDRWLRNFFYVNYFDSFEGNHPRVFVPKERPYREFESMEDICNYLLGHKEVLDRVEGARARRQGRVRHVRRRDRGGGGRGRPGDRPPVGRAAPPPGLEDRHHAARQRGRACRARRTRSGARRPTRS